MRIVSWNILNERPRVPLASCYLTPVAESELPDSHPGASAVADVSSVRDDFLFTAASIYGQWEMMPGGKSMYACARLHRMISDLTGVLATSRQRPVILAGDLNLTTQWAKSLDDNAANAFARLRAWGMTDCLMATRADRPRLAGCTCPEGEDCSHVRTYRARNSPTSDPTQLDYVFVSDSILPRLKSCRVDDSDAAWALSDHCPVVLDLEE